MAKITFSSENKQTTFDSYPKLKFENKGEKARVAILDDMPEVSWVHTLRAPATVNGQVVMETVPNKDGGTTQRAKMEFVGQHLCFGNDNVLAEKKKDPANCPTCAAGNESEAIEPPRRRMAIHVIRYKTQPGTFKPQEPFQAELLAWVFGEKIFDSLVSIAEEHGDLRSKDLLLECSNKMFQNVDLQVGGAAAWLGADENKKFVQSLFATNKCDDFAPLLARKVTRQQAEDDITKVRLRHAQAFGGTTEAVGSAPSVSETAAAVNLDDILSGPSETTTPTSAAAPWDATTTAAPEETASAAPPAVTEAPAPAAEPSAPAGGGDVLDFDALLQGL